MIISDKNKPQNGKKLKRKREQRLLSAINEYFNEMKDTSRLIDPIILSCFNKSNISKDEELSQKLYETAMGRIGKPKMRSYTARLGYDVCDGKNLNGLLPMAAAMDLLEFSYYCSDKIFDTDIYNDRNFTEDKIIASQILVSDTFNLVADSAKKLDLNAEQTREIVAGTSRFIKDIYEGFFLENHNTKPSKEVYERRTYAYNYWEHILRMSATAAGADKEKIDALSNFGKYVGMAYMVTNDISDIVKDFEDIKNSRYTLPNILFLEKAADDEKLKFEKVFGNTSANVDELKEIGQNMVNKGIVNECQQYASELIKKALPFLGIFEDTHPKKMLATATMAVYRNQWYHAMKDQYGYQRTVSSPDLELAEIYL